MVPQASLLSCVVCTTLQLSYLTPFFFFFLKKMHKLKCYFLSQVWQMGS